MAHLGVTVCLPPEAADDIEGALDEALAPCYLDNDSDEPGGRGTPRPSAPGVCAEDRAPSPGTVIPYNSRNGRSSPVPTASTA
ncbi:hypothetical protein [Kitasatospora sp. NPDC092286]|uniref:hypothetical protein n=1 Tax=Kitasatospora sp. NPDC092286 TaxID=3364087 RepID=UPI0038178B1F